MKTKILWLLTWIMMTVSGCSTEEVKADLPDNTDSENPAVPTENRKVLIVYFSHTGNTRTIAGYIHDAVESDMIELQTEEPYTDDYDTLLEQARKETAAGYCPPLTTQIDSIDSYDVIFVGYPIWVGTAAPPIRTFLTEYNLSGKTVIPFCTSGTSSAEESYRLVRSLCPQSDVLEGIQIRRGTYDTAQERVIAWLQETGIINLQEKTNER